jgi:fructokinase
MTALVVGEVLVDLVWHTGAAGPVPAIGGSPVNVAQGLHRLERPVRAVTVWGDDPPGALVAAHLAATGLPITRAESASGRTTVAVAYLDEATGSARYGFLVSWDPGRVPVPDDTVLMHTGSLAVVVEPGAARVREAARTVRARTGGAVAVDLNVRPAVQPDRAAYRNAVHAVVAEADVVKASDEDLAYLYPERSAEESARALSELGPRLVVVTRGGRGAFGLVDGAAVHVAAPTVDVVDTIGAGDAFQAALLAAVLEPAGGGSYRVSLPTDRDGLARILHRAVTAGALACTRAGANPPDRAQLDAALGSPETLLSGSVR